MTPTPSERGAVLAPYRDLSKTLWGLGYKPIPIHDEEGARPNHTIIPHGKTFPPAGTTGEKGTVTKEKVKQLRAARPDHNIAVRPEGFIAVDVDDYTKANGEVKTGGADFAAKQAELGELPDTVRVTARGYEGVSGQYYYRLPEGVDPRVKFKSRIGPCIEILQYGHRFAVAPGSIHPDLDGKTYQAWDANGNLLDTLPKLSNLPVLPSAWFDFLLDPKGTGDDNPDALPWQQLLDTFKAGPACFQGVKFQEDYKAEDHIGHNQAIKYAFRGFRLGLEGHHGMAEVLTDLYDRHLAYVAGTGRPMGAVERAFRDSALEAQTEPVADADICDCDTLGSDLYTVPGDTPKDKEKAKPSAEVFPELEEARAALHPEAFKVYEHDFRRDQSTKYRSDQAFLRSGRRFTDSNLCLSGILAYPEPDWLVENMLPRDSLVLGYGDSGLGKTSYFVTVGLCIASGTKFTGLPVKQRKALYVAAEGPALIPMLVRAWLAAHPGVVLAEDSFTLHTIPLNLDSASAVADAKAAITEGQYGAVFIDTLVAGIGEKDESSPGHMSALMAEGKDLVSGVPGASLVFVHHTGYDKSHPRGATSLYAAADAVIKLSGERGAGKPVRVQLEKNRYGRTGDIGNVVLVPEHGSVVVRAKGDLPTLTEELKGRHKSWALLYETYHGAVTSNADLVRTLTAPEEDSDWKGMSRTGANRHISELCDFDQALTLVSEKPTKKYTIKPPATTPVVPET